MSNRTATGAVALAIALQAASAAAQNPTAAPLNRSAAVTVSATRIETSLERVASSVTVIEGEELRRKQHRLVVDALREVPGVDVKRNGGPGSNTSIFLRGAESDHTLVLVDGVELNDPSAPSRVPFLNHLTTDEVERIEILRGPQSGVWGGDAIGGVVNVITRSGEGPLSASAWGEAGSYQTGRGGLRVSGSGGPFRALAAVSYGDTSGFSARESGREDDAYHNLTGVVRLGLEPHPNLDLDLMVRHVDARIDFDESSRERGVSTDANQTLGRLGGRRELYGGRWVQELALRHSHHERDTESSFSREVDGDLFALEWRNDLRWVEGHTITVGAEHEWEWANSGSIDDSARTLAFYAQDQFERGAVFGTLGLRLDDHSDFGSEVTYRAGLGYRIEATGTTLRATAGTGFKAPALGQLNSRVSSGNPDLEPETARGFDLGVEQSLPGGLGEVGAAFFANDIDDIIVAVFDAGRSSFVNFNVDEARTRGVEAWFRARASKRAELRGSYTWTDTEARGQPAGFGLREGGRLLRRPSHKAGIELRSLWIGNRLDTTLRLSWVGGRSDLDPTTFATVRAEDYVVVDASARLRLREGMRLFARIENALDRDYEDVLGFSTPGFSAYGGLEVTF